MGVADYYYLAGSDYVITGPATGNTPWAAPATMSKKILGVGELYSKYSFQQNLHH